MLLDSALVTAVVLLTVTTVTLLVAQARTAQRLTTLERQLRRGERRAAPAAGTDEKGRPVDDPATSGLLEGDAVDIEGVAPDGRPVTVRLEESQTPTLLAFLSSSCGICAGVWTRLREEDGTVGDTSVVVVTKDPAQEDLELVRRLAGTDERPTSVMSSEAWVDYEVPRSPYVVVVGGSPSSVLAEGAVDGWDGLVALASRTGRPS